jgi:hypothetical protein
VLLTLRLVCLDLDARPRCAPVGVLALVTSLYTLDKQNAATHEYLAERADFLEVIRLPSDAFKHEGTLVFTDIIFLRKTCFWAGTASRRSGVADKRTAFGRSDRSRLVPRDDINADERGRWCATRSVRDRHWSWAQIRILGEAEARPARTITAVGRDVVGR